MKHLLKRSTSQQQLNRPSHHARASKASQKPPPPTIVIRARASYTATSDVELSFCEGDFFHVLGQAVDPVDNSRWFEAENPSSGVRGIVPADKFNQYSKPVHPEPQTPIRVTSTPAPARRSRARSIGDRHQADTPVSGGPDPPPRPQVQTEPPGHAARSARSARSEPHGCRPARPAPPRSPLCPPPTPPPHTAPHTGERCRSLYGHVRHTFRAERKDELDAKAGEPVIVIAHSNEDWFVAKPIGRLGGPGLIPVSYVEIRDLSTGAPLMWSEVQELIASGAVPPVDEWKLATAAYKGNSITLGQLEVRQPATVPATATSFRKAEMVREWQRRQTDDRPAPAVLARYGTFVGATVDAAYRAQGLLWVDMRVQLSGVEELGVQRLYDEFVELGRALCGQPALACWALPSLGEDVEDVAVEETLQGCVDALARASRRIRETEAVEQLFGPREGDLAGGWARQTMAMQRAAEEEVIACLARMGVHEPDGGPASPRSPARRRASSLCASSPSVQRISASTAYSTNPSSTCPTHLPAPQRKEQKLLKIKLYDLATGDLMALKVPNTLRFVDLVQRVEARLDKTCKDRAELVLRIREDGIASSEHGHESAPGKLGGGRFVKITNDEDLERWTSSGRKLVLYV